MSHLPIVRLLEYDQWATARLFERVANLSEEQYAREFTGPDSSMRQQCCHLLSVSDRYRARLMKEPVPDLSADDLRTMDQSLAYQSRVRTSIDDLIARIEQTNLSEVVRHDTRRGTFIATVEETLLHMVNHGTYHRGQIAWLLKLHGLEPIDTDFLIWVKIQSGSAQ